MIGELRFIDYCDFLYEPLPKFSVKRNQHLTVITTNRGVLTLKLHPDLEKHVNYINYYKLFIKPSTYMLVNHLEIDIGSFFFSLPQDSIFLCLLQSNVTGGMENIKKTEFFMSKSCVSPNQLVGEECLIATITDVGSLDLYVRVCHIYGLTKYEHVLNISQLHIDKFRYRWTDTAEKTPQEKLDEAMNRLSIHTAKAFCWTNLFHNAPANHKTMQHLPYCCLIVGYANGHVVFWHINQTPMVKYKEVQVQVMLECKTKMSEITTMCWFNMQGNSGLLIVGNQAGKVIILPVFNVLIDYCKTGEEILLTDETDMPVEHIEVEVKNGYMIIHVVQQSHILMFVLDKDADVLERMDLNCSNFNITGMQKTSHGTLLVSTLTGALLEIQTTIKKSKLHVEKRPIYMNMDWTKNNLLDIILSENDTILSLVTFHYGYHFSGRLKMKVWNFVHNEKQTLNKFMALDRISDGYDLLEVLRVASFQKKQLLGNELPKDTNYDELTILELKKYLCIAKISETVVDTIETLHEYNLKQATDIISMIYIQLSIYLLGLIVKEFKAEEAISDYKRQVAHVCYTNLKDIVISNFLKLHKLNNNYLREITHVLNECKGLKLEENVICKICEQAYAGLTCPMRHADNRCSFTMVQLINSSLKCPICCCYVSEEAATFTIDGILNCMLCDSPLETVISGVNEPYEVNVNCKKDCI